MAQTPYLESKNHYPILDGLRGVASILVIVFLRLPTSFLPQEDQGTAQIQYTLPPGATMERTLAAVKTIEKYFLAKEKANVTAIYTVLGQSQQGAAQNAGRGFIAFKPWDDRKGSDNAAPAITLRVYAHVIRTAETAAADIFTEAVKAA